MLLCPQIVASLLVVFSLFAIAQSALSDRIPDSRKKVLFFSDTEAGQANVHLATSYALLTKHQNVDVHYASWPKLKKRLETVSDFATKTSPQAGSIEFHRLPDPSYVGVLEANNYTVEKLINPPGLQGLNNFLENLEIYMVPWNAQEYAHIYQGMRDLIDQLEPDCIVLDPLLATSAHATRDSGRKYVVLSPNSMKDTFSPMQPWGAYFWKFPALQSAFEYPVPWSKLLRNIQYNFHLIYAVLRTPKLRQLNSELKDLGLTPPRNMFSIYDAKVPFIAASLPEIEYPMTLPANVTTCGPITLSVATVAERDPELHSWLEQRPTVLINQGSHVEYTEASAMEMARAIKVLLEQRDVQVLWKVNKKPGASFSDDYLAPLESSIASGRVKVTDWITVDPPALLETGHVALYVHHGGASCFHEAIANAVPHVILPMWMDHYDIAVRSEWLGIGIWASRGTAPDWTSQEVAAALLKATGDGEDAVEMRRKARHFAELTGTRPGRDIAAQVIVDYIDGKVGQVESVGGRTSGGIESHGEL